MHVVFGWFSRRALPASGPDEAALFGGPAARVEQAFNQIAPDSYVRHTFGGPDWGVMVGEASVRDGWLWPVLATDGPVSTISLGIPVGFSGTAPELGKRLLAGEDIQALVAPPFSAVALEGDRRAVVQQDWLGMGRVYFGEADDIVYFASRASLIADMIGPHKLDRAGWISYVMCGHFGGEHSPYDGVRILAPGERLTLTHRPGGGWDAMSQIGTNIDDLVKRGLEVRSRPFDELLDMAADGITKGTASIHSIYDKPILLGLSGGKDSRLIFASMLAGGMIPKLRTNIDTPAEGEIATQLVSIIRERRGLDLEHELALVAQPESVTTVGLLERIQRLQSTYDYQFSSTYTIRRAGTGALPEAATNATITGAGGELVTGYWYGDPNEPKPDPAALLRTHLMLASGPDAPAQATVEAEEARIAAQIARGAATGLEGLDLVDYVYLLERVRRWYSSGFSVGMVTPFLTPGFVSASFAVTPQQKRERVLHFSLLKRLTPEFEEVPFVSIRTGRSTATRVWEGDGLEVVHKLLDTVQGGVTDLMRRDVVAKAIARSARGGGNGTLQKVLQQYACLATATRDFEPSSVRPPTQTYETFLRGNRQQQTSAWSPIVRQMRRTAVGRAVVSALKSARSRL